MILAIFDLQVTWYFLSSLESTGLSVQKFKTDFQDGDCGSHIGFLIRTNLAIFDLQMTLMLSTKFRDNWPVGSGEKRNIHFQDSSHGGFHGFLIRMILAIFFIYKSPWCFLPSIKSTGLSVQDKKWTIDFQDGHHGSHLGYPIGTISAIHLLVIQCFLPSFKSIGLLVQEKKWKQIFQMAAILDFLSEPF